MSEIDPTARLRDFLLAGPGDRKVTIRDLSALSWLLFDHARLARELEEGKRAYDHLRAAMDPDPDPIPCKARKV